jgi:hypothetical protein
MAPVRLRMIRKSLLVAFSALVIAWVIVQAQDTSRRIELRIADANRGYMRPMRTTAERIKAIAGLEESTAIGAKAGIMRFSLKTTLTDEQIASALSLEIVDAKKGSLLLAPRQSSQAFRAEARLAILEIADALRKQGERAAGNYAYSDNGYAEERTSLSGTIEQKMKALGLDAKLLDGKFFKARDYHIDARGGAYLIYAGAKWEGLSANRDYEYPDYSGGDEREASEPDFASTFVGARLQVNEWNSGLWWADLHGLALNESQISRDAPDARDGSKLQVQRGGERIVGFLQLAAKFRFEGENAGKALDALPKGNLNSNRKIAQAFRKEDEEYYWEPYYGNQTMSLSWFKDDAGHSRARIRAYHSRHTLHLDGDIDCDAAKEVDFDFNKVEVHWTVAPETELGIFERRRAEISRGLDAIRDALFALDAPSLDAARKAPINGEALLAALGMKAEALKGEFFSATDYWMRPQIMGDVELAAGTALAGCESWTLLNMSEKSAIRSNK